MDIKNSVSESVKKNERNHIINGHVDQSELYLFDPSILDELDFSQCKAKYEPKISSKSPGHGLRVRPLSCDDFDRGYLKLLQQLTVVGPVTREMFKIRFLSMKNCPNVYYVMVIEDLNKDIIIGNATLIIEHKFIHSAGLRGRIEDVVVSDQYRGKQLGKLLLDTACLLAQKLNVYKLSLDCKDQMVPFYQMFGLQSEGTNMLVKRYSDLPW